MNNSFDKKILLVDDQEEILSLLYEELKDSTELKSEQIILATSGNEAIHLIESGEKFDLIVSDYSMDNGNGLRILNYITVHSIDTKFILYTSSLNIKVVTENHNYLGIIYKTDIERLISRIQETL